jgi:hypothetical protein
MEPATEAESLSADYSAGMFLSPSVVAG